MSRALVRAGITNYLSAGINVSKEQVKWVISIVAKVEGDEVAKKLDELAWGWMERVYAGYTKRHGLKKREMTPRPRVKVEREKNGLLKGVVPFARARDEGRYPRRTRWYKANGTVKYTDLDEMFGKQLYARISKQWAWRKDSEAVSPDNESNGDSKEIAWTEDHGQSAYRPEEAIDGGIYVE
jgi:hypothetical protein